MPMIIDHASRKRMAELGRHLVAGRITNDAFEAAWPRSEERELYEVFYSGFLPLYSGLEEHTLTGHFALDPETRHAVARVILFLRAGEPYRWPLITGLRQLPVGVLSILTLGWYGRYWLRQHWRLGDVSVWPFFNRTEYHQALSQPVYLRGRQAT